MIRYLSHEDLGWKFLDQATATKILKQRKAKVKAGNIGSVAQDRAMKALELGLGIRQKGYNISFVHVFRLLSIA